MEELLSQSYVHMGSLIVYTRLHAQTLENPTPTIALRFVFLKIAR